MIYSLPWLLGDVYWYNIEGTKSHVVTVQCTIVHKQFPEREGE